MGPIGVKAHLAPFLPTHPIVPTGALPNFKGDKVRCAAMCCAALRCTVAMLWPCCAVAMPSLMQPSMQPLAGEPSGKWSC